MPDPVAPGAQRRRVDWGVLSVEAGAIFLSVLLGFAVTEWRQARADRLTVRHALSAYANEIAENQGRVVAGFAYHVALDDSLAERIEGPPSDRPLFVTLDEAGWQGPRQVVFRTAARATAEATGVLGLLPFEQAAVLVGLYDAQKELDATEQALADAAFNPAILDQANAAASLRTMSLYFQMVTEQERNLLRGYREAIETLGLDLVPAVDTLLAERPR